MPYRRAGYLFGPVHTVSRIRQGRVYDAVFSH